MRVGAEGARNTAFLCQVEAGMSVSRTGGFVCIKVGPWDEATAALFALLPSSFHHTLWLTLLHHLVQRLSQQVATAN